MGDLRIRGPIGDPPILVNCVGKTAGLCRWFLGCQNKATKTIDHPTLGKVPTCKACYDRVEEMLR
jgi:hypothetical protein